MRNTRQTTMVGPGMTTNLKFRTIVNGRVQHATGRYPQWRYELYKGGDSSASWSASFIDENDKWTPLLQGVSYARAKAAANAHHNGPSFSGI